MKYLTISFCHHFLLITQYLSLTKFQCKGESDIEQYDDENQTTTTTSKLSVIEDHDIWIEINCYNITDYNEFQKRFSTRTNSIRNKTRTLRIYNCPLPENGSSLGTILRKFGILIYRNLSIQNYDLPTAQLKRQQLGNFQELSSLTLEMNHLKHLPSDLFTDATLRNLQTLVLNTNASEIPSNLFQNLENIQYLSIGHSLESLVPGQFHNQKNLLELNLSNNKLKNIASNIFPNDGLVKKIYLQNNLLESLPSEIFATLTSLTTININSNKFQKLPPKLFENNMQLREFELTRNQGYDLLTLPEKFLSNLLQLKKVIIKCGLESLPDDVFYNSTNIEKIRLDHNKLKDVPDNLLESQVNLNHLDLSHNNLNRINGKLFQNTEELKILKLSHNQLQTIQSNPNPFTKLDKLQTLDLSHNQLNSNFRIQLELNTNLNYLNLQNNSITELFILKKLPRYLHQLDLSFNKIYHLSGKDLELSYTNDLTLNLTHNRIETIQLEDFGIHNLLDTLSVTTHLNHNPLQCDCKILKSMKYLNENKNHIKFETGNLTCWGPSQLKGTYLKDVKEMDLLCSLDSVYNGTYKCPHECKCFIRKYDNILLMDCSHRNLSQIPKIDSIRDINIKGIELNLTGNKITNLPPLLAGGYAECTKLFLYQNNLSEINKSQIPLNLTHLDLRQNHLQFINQETLRYLNDQRFLQTIMLSGNKWKCDCSDEVLFLLHTIQNNRTKFIDGSNVTCHNYSGKQFFQKLNVSCQQRKIFNIIMICLSVTFILILLTLYYKFQKEIKILLYQIFPRIFGKHDDGDKKYDAFISYSHKDEDFVANYLVPELENGNPPFKLCVHVRDFVVGDYIPDQIVKSIADSRRIIVVLSKHFIESEWAKLEFKEACRATLTERRNKIIAIMYEDIRDMANLDKDLRLYLKTNTYIKWGDPWFWQNIRYAMRYKK